MNEVKTNVNVNIDNLFSEFNKQAKINHKLTIVTTCLLVLLACEKKKISSKNAEIANLKSTIDDLKGMKGD